MDTIRIIIVIAWRNLWRNKVRSAVVIAAMAVGIWAGIFLSGFSMGMNEQRTQSALNTFIGYVQVHPEGWKEEARADMFLSDESALEEDLRNTPGYVAHSARLVQTGMAASSRGALGVMIQGVDPAEDTLVFDLSTRLVEGEYLPVSGRVPYAYIGTALAEKLKLRLGDRLQLTFQDIQGYPTQALFRVGGMFTTVSSMFDKSSVVVRKEDMAALMSVSPDMAHEVVVKLKDRNEARTWASGFQSSHPGTEVEAWQEVSPELGYADDMMAFSLYIFIGIILFAVTFGILNTMLMAILERKRELGMLMAVGMNKTRTFTMIVVETLFLGCVGAPLGILLGHFTLLTSGRSGFDLSSVGEGLNSYGMDSVVYPVPVPDYYGGISIMVLVLTLLASLYPAIKALKLNPVEAIRSV